MYYIFRVSRQIPVHNSPRVELRVTVRPRPTAQVHAVCGILWIVRTNEDIQVPGVDCDRVALSVDGGVVAVRLVLPGASAAVAGFELVRRKRKCSPTVGAPDEFHDFPRLDFNGYGLEFVAEMADFSSRQGLSSINILAHARLK